MKSNPERISRIGPDIRRLLFGDLHNHSVLTDGGGGPAQSFAGIRAAGLDVAGDRRAWWQDALVAPGLTSDIDPLLVRGGNGP